MTDRTDMQAVIDAARRGVAITPLEGFTEHRAFFNPLGRNGQGEVVQEPLNLDAPTRKRGTVDVFDAAAFNQVLRDNAMAGRTSIYIDRQPEAPAVVAVINGHGPAGPGWGDFRARLIFRRTPQWERWRKIDGKLLSQADFAEFIEDNLEDIQSPGGAAMLEIASELTAKRSFDFRSAIRTSDGQVQFTNVENIEARVGPGQIAVPESFTLGIAPLQGSQPYAVPVRFRYRLADGKLSLGIKLQRVEDLMGRVLEDVIAKIERGANISVLDGLPPAVVTPQG